MKKFRRILNNYINGNLSDYYQEVRKLSKVKLLEFIEFAQSQGVQRHIIINSYRNKFER